MPTRPTKLTKLTVNLYPRAVAALEEAVRLTGDNKSDSVNRALQVYAYLEQEWASGSKVQVTRTDGSVESLRLIG